MYLIATDEAGYGPKLGPLVIVATLWEIPGQERPAASWADCFAPLSTPFRQGAVSFCVDDSKKVYRPGEGLSVLHAMVSAGLDWCGAEQRSLPDLLETLCPEDGPAIAESPWLSIAEPIPLAEPELTRPLIEHWSRDGVQLIGARARVITAKQFNGQCRQGFNKADLLSMSTLRLVDSLISDAADPSLRAEVFCDRHGGRRYYAAPLQHQFPDWLLRIVSESKSQSDYRLERDGAQLDVHFTVKGDRFAPVAFSSLVAKYLRERFMEAINGYFAQRHDGPIALKPTAGYPVDAERFLDQIAPIRQREGIADSDLIRMR